MAQTKLLVPSAGSRNLVYNPEGLLMQRIDPVGGTNVNNDVFGPDRWNILSSTNAVNVKRSTDAPGGSRHSIQLQKATSSGFMGMCQMLEASESIPLAGQMVTFSIWLKSATLTSARIAVLGWNGTADSITSSLVSSWGATSTYIANVVELGATNCTITSAWTQFSVTCQINNANNLMFFIQTGASATTSDSLFVSQAQCTQTTQVQSYVRRSNQTEVAMNQRYYSKSYDLDAIPGTATENANLTSRPNSTSPTGLEGFQFPVRMRATPTVVIWAPDTGASGNAVRWTGATVTASSPSSISEAGVGFVNGTYVDDQYRFHFTADAEL